MLSCWKGLDPSTLAFPFVSFRFATVAAPFFWLRWRRNGCCINVYTEVYAGINVYAEVYAGINVYAEVYAEVYAGINVYARFMREVYAGINVYTRFMR